MAANVRPIPEGFYIDQDTTDAFLDKDAPVYESGHTPEEQRARVDALLESGAKLPEKPGISEG